MATTPQTGGLGSTQITMPTGGLMGNASKVASQFNVQPTQQTQNKVFTATPTPLIKPVVDTTAVNYGAVTGSQQPVPNYNDNMQASNNLGTSAMNQLTVAPEPTARQKEMSSFSSLIDKLGTETERTLAIQEQNQYAQKNQILADANARALRTSQDFDRQEQLLMQNSEGKTTNALNGDINNLRRERNQAVSAIALEQAVALGNVNAAKDTIKMQVDAEFEPIKNQIEAKKSWFQLYNDDLSTSERVILENQLKKETDEYNAGVKNTTLTKSAETYQKMLDENLITVKDVPKEVIGYLNIQGYTSPEQKTSKTTTVSRLATVDELLTTKLGFAVGPGIQGVLGKMGGFVGLGNYETKRKVVDNLIANLTLDVLPSLKGPTSDRDIEFITKAASAINPNSKETDFKASLLDLRKKITTGIVNSNTYTKEEKIKVTAEQFKLEDPSATSEQIQGMIKSVYPELTFSQAGNATASNVANAIKTVESQGNYNARGPVVTSGTYKGERALGAYQIMPSNLASWSKEALGRTVSEKEFLSNPSIQDQIAQSRFENLLKRYSPEDVASIWFSGRPLASNTAKDVTGTSVPEYVKRVMNNLKA